MPTPMMLLVIRNMELRKSMVLPPPTAWSRLLLAMAPQLRAPAGTRLGLDTGLPWSAAVSARGDGSGRPRQRRRVLSPAPSGTRGV